MLSRTLISTRRALVATAPAVLAALAIFAALYYGMPSLFKEPLLSLNRSLSGMEERSTEAAMHTIHYLDSGPPHGTAPPSETPIVLLHGIFAEKDHWVDFARPLTGAHRVIALDIPGHGESTRLGDQAYDYAAHTARLAAFLDALGLARVHLAGNSMGGTIAALFALQHPDRVASVAFMGAPHGIRSPKPSAMDLRIDAGERPLVAHDAAAFGAMMDLVFAKRPFIPYPILHAAEREALRNAASNERVWDAQLKDRYLLQQHLGRLQPHPVLVLWGEHDRVFDVSGVQTVRGLLPTAQIAVLPGLGHLPMMEAPKETAARYAQFLAQAKPRP